MLKGKERITLINEAYSIIKKRDNEVISNIIKLFRKRRAVPAFFDDMILTCELSYFFMFLDNDVYKNKNKFTASFDNFYKGLFEEKHYRGIVIIKGVSELPIGTQIGELKIINKDMLKKDMKKDIEELNKSLMSINPHKWSDFDKCSIAEAYFNSYSTSIFNIGEEFVNGLDYYIPAISFIMGGEIVTSELPYIIYRLKGKKHEILLSSLAGDSYGRKTYQKEQSGEMLNKISRVYTKRTYSKLENKIIKSIQIVKLSDLSKSYEVKLLILMSAIECLLITSTDKDNISKGIAEKTSILLENDDNKRSHLANKMKDYYQQRSMIIHGNKVKIEGIQVSELAYIHRKLIMELLNL